MPLLTRSRAAILLALPAFLVPVIEIPVALWARTEFLARNPDYLDDPPTISRAISDPAIGGPVAILTLVVAALILLSMPGIVRAYLHAIARLPLGRTRKLPMWALLAFFTLAQLTACYGMVLTTQYTFANNDGLHMLGSYIFFPAQALALLGAAILCRLLLLQCETHGISDTHWPFRPGMHRFRFRFAVVVVLLAVSYGVLFVVKDWSLPVSNYVAHVIYTQCEVVVIASYVLFIGSYSVDLLDMVSNDRLRPPPAGVIAPNGATALPPPAERSAQGLSPGGRNC